jgi:pilus assembly protein CpaB
MIVRVILLLLGLISGVLLAAASFYGLFGSSPPQQAAAPAPPPPPQTMIVVAARVVPTGSLLTLQDLKFAPPPNKEPVSAAEYVRASAPTPTEQATSDSKTLAEIAGAVTRARFNDGDPIIRGDVVKPGDAGFLAAVLRPGKRAVTIGVTVVTGAAGLVYPGDHVDVILTQVFPGHENDPGNRSVAESLASDLRVIAVDQQLQSNVAPNKDGKPAQTVTLEVDALQSEQVAVGAKMGELSLVIRGVNDEEGKPPEASTDTPVWAKDISHAASDVRPAAGDKASPGGSQGKSQVRVIHGDKVENVAVP